MQAVSVGAAVIVIFGAFITFVVVLDLSTVQRDGSILISNAKTFFSWVAQKIAQANATPGDPATQPLTPN